MIYQRFTFLEVLGEVLALALQEKSLLDRHKPNRKFPFRLSGKREHEGCGKGGRWGVGIIVIRVASQVHGMLETQGLCWFQQILQGVVFSNGSPN